MRPESLLSLPSPLALSAVSTSAIFVDGILRPIGGREPLVDGMNDAGRIVAQPRYHPSAVSAVRESKWRPRGFLASTRQLRKRDPARAFGSTATQRTERRAEET